MDKSRSQLRRLAVMKELDTADLMARIAELEAVLNAAELILTGLAMSPDRHLVCTDDLLTKTLIQVRAARKAAKQ